MIRQLAFAAAVVAAGPASALSCAQGTVENAYVRAAESPVDYVIAVGQLLLSGPSNPPEGAVALGGDINQMQGYTQPARFTGDLFTGNGFDTSQELSITVDVTCTIAWCGSATNVTHGLFFFSVANGAYTLTADACRSQVFPDAHPGMLEEVVTCHQGSCNGAW